MIVCGVFLASLKLITGCFKIPITPSLSGADTYMLSSKFGAEMYVELTQM